jgi:hypothetical protein
VIGNDRDYTGVEFVDTPECAKAVAEVWTP